MKRYQHFIDVRGEVLPTPRGTTSAVETSATPILSSKLTQDIYIGI